MPDTIPASLRSPPDPADRDDTARFIGHVAGELRGLAVQADLPFLAYLLAMTEEDALSAKGS